MAGAYIIPPVQTAFAADMPHIFKWYPIRAPDNSMITTLGPYTDTVKDQKLLETDVLALYSEHDARPSVRDHVMEVVLRLHYFDPDVEIKQPRGEATVFKIGMRQECNAHISQRLKRLGDGEEISLWTVHTRHINVTIRTSVTEALRDRLFSYTHGQDQSGLIFPIGYITYTFLTEEEARECALKVLHDHRKVTGGTFVSDPEPRRGGYVLALLSPSHDSEPGSVLRHLAKISEVKVSKGQRKEVVVLPG